MAASSVTGSLARLDLGGKAYRYFSLAAAEAAGLGVPTRLPLSLKVLFENLLRSHFLQRSVTLEDIEALGRWPETRAAGKDIAYYPARMIMPDSSGIPLLADLAAMRDAMVDLGGDPKRINPISRVDVVVDHSAIVDVSGAPNAAERNLEIEYQRNRERYEFLRWAQSAFSNLRIVPSGQGIIHQINLEYLAGVVLTEEAEGDLPLLFPDTVLGMDSHTPMVNALSILGWGCGGIEAGAAMLGQPVSMRIPEVVGMRFTGKLRPGVTATDLVLTVTERLRQLGVVQKFVEYFGPGLAGLPMSARATISNMAPEYGATVGFFPTDEETLAYLRQTGRSAEHVALVEAYARAQGLWAGKGESEPQFTTVLELDLSEVEASLAGPRRPQDRVPLGSVPASLDRFLEERGGPRHASVPVAGQDYSLSDGDIAVAAITSCTNTSNPQVIVGAALLARNALRAGLAVKPWVKTSFSPGSRVVADYLARTGLQQPLDALGFNIVGYGCMTCMGNSGPLAEPIVHAVDQQGLALAAVLSGNRNFEGRVHTQCRINYLASPPLVVAYALAGSVSVDLTRHPLGKDPDGAPVYLADIWPDDAEIEKVVAEAIDADLFRERYRRVFEGDGHWQALPVHGGDTFDWRDSSWYIRRPPFFAGLDPRPGAILEISNARALAMFGDSVTTDHISPIGVIGVDSPAGTYLRENGIAPRDFNSYASRRVNHDVMIRGTFASPRLRNELAGGREGGFTRHMPDGEALSIYEAAMRYRGEGVPLVIVAGRDYGAGSSRDWAAKGTMLLGVRAVIAEGFERIHRSNLIGMGVVPLQFKAGDSRSTLGLDGSETWNIEDLDSMAPGGVIACSIGRLDGTVTRLELMSRVDTSYELEYLRHGGILQFMVRHMLDAA